MARRDRFARFFLKKEKWVRFFAGALLLFSIALFLHVREVKVDLLELDSSAKGYVVAQVDFAFPDPDATLILKQEMVRPVGEIYRIPPEEMKDAEGRILKELSSRSFSKEKKSFSAGEVEPLLKKMDMLAERTLFAGEETLHQLSKLYPKGVLLQPIEGEERGLPASFWEEVEKRLEKEAKPAAVSYLLNQLKTYPFKLERDTKVKLALLQHLEAQVAEVYTEVRAGAPIIAYGEKVTSRHVAMLAAMKKVITEQRNLWQWRTIISSLIFSAFVVWVGWRFFFSRKRSLLNSPRLLFLYTTIIILVLSLAKGGEWILLANNSYLGDLLRYPIFVPFASILLSLLISEEVSLISTYFLAIIMGLTLAIGTIDFLFLNSVTGTYAAIASQGLKKRKEIFFLMGQIFSIAALIVLTYNFVLHSLISLSTFYDLFFLAINNLIIGVLLIGLMPLMEAGFKVMTDMTLMEYMDPTHPLLRRLSLEAPGTYQHSLSIGHIAEYVAGAIGANALFCRISALYHDVGKLAIPHYFTENQRLKIKQKFNPHELLTPTESACLIKAHVADGIALAKEHKLPKPFLDIIAEHHGTTRMRYFYQKQLEKVGGDSSQVDESIFRYDGPKPQSKESVIIMLADSVEAASRSIKEEGEEKLKEQLEEIIRGKLLDGQFDEAPLTLKELHLIKEKICEILRATHHVRISYPSEK